MEGADGIEVDLRLTGDDRVVLVHDESALRTTGVDLRIAETSWDMLRSLDAGAWKGPQWKTQKIPLLRDALRVLPAHRVIMAELKCGTEGLEALRREMKGFAPHPESVVFVGFSVEVLEAVRHEFRDHKTLLNVEAPAGPAGAAGYPSAAAIEAARRSHLHGLSLAWSDVLSPDDLHAARKAGLEVAVWTVNDDASARRAAELRVDYLMTDRPAAIRKALSLLPPS